MIEQPRSTGTAALLLECAAAGNRRDPMTSLDELERQGVLSPQVSGILRRHGLSSSAALVNHVLLARDLLGRPLTLPPDEDTLVAEALRRWLRRDLAKGLDPAVAEAPVTGFSTGEEARRFCVAHGVLAEGEQPARDFGILRGRQRRLEKENVTWLGLFDHADATTEIRGTAALHLREAAARRYATKKEEASAQEFPPSVAGQPGLEAVYRAVTGLWVSAGRPVTGRASPAASFTVEGGIGSIRVRISKHAGCAWEPTVTVDLDPPRVRCSCGATTGVCGGARAALAAIRFALHDREEVRQFQTLGPTLLTPGWQRWLDRMPAPPPPLEADERRPQIAFRIDPMRLTVEAGLARSTRRPGVHTWSSPRHGDLDRAERGFPADDLLLLFTTGNRAGGGDRVRAEVLRALAGHPLVFWGEERITVRRAEGRIEWRPETGGLGAVLAWDGGVVPIPRAAHGLPGGTGLVLPMRDDRGLCIVEVPSTLQELLAFLALQGHRVPAEGAEALLSRVLEANHRDVALGQGVLPREVAGLTDPMVELRALPTGELRVAVLVRPWEGLAARVPGAGAPMVVAVDGNGRFGVQRDLVGEVLAAHTLLARLALPEPATAEPVWTLPATDESHEWLTRLRGLDPPVMVEWVGTPRRSVAATALRSLQLQVHRLSSWFGVEATLRTELGMVDLEDLLDAMRAGRKFVRVRGEDWVGVDDQIWDAIRALGDFTQKDGRMRKLRVHAAHGVDALEAAGVSVRAPKEFRAYGERVREAARLDPPAPHNLHATLRPYQLEGFRYLVRLSTWAPGGCLADDMGLGKTIQALAFLLHRGGRALVIAPTSVLWNWQREASGFAPDLRIIPYAGPGRAALLDDLREGDVVLASWDILVRDQEALAAIPWSTLVSDEAQAMKNPQSLRAKAARSLQAGFRLALTGTPIENRTAELWSLFAVTVPGLLGNWEEWSRVFGIPAERHKDPHARAAIARLIRPFVLRRLKSEVAKELPPRTEVRLEVDLSTEERELYEKVRQSALSALEADSKPGQQRLVVALTALLRLRQICCDATLFQPDCGVASSKLDALDELLSELADEGHQALIFSQFTSLLDRVQARLEAAGYSLARLDGSTPAAQRQSEVEAFQAGQRSFFLLSLKAGGVGLNLTAASYVVHLDPWWNPAVEAQATDRAHRIGQDKPVTVYRLVAAGTVEDRVLAMHAEKRALAEAVLDGTGTTAALDAETVLSLLSEGPPGASPRVLKGSKEKTAPEGPTTTETLLGVQEVPTATPSEGPVAQAVPPTQTTASTAVRRRPRSADGAPAGAMSIQPPTGGNGVATTVPPSLGPPPLSDGAGPTLAVTPARVDPASAEEARPARRRVPRPGPAPTVPASDAVASPGNGAGASSPVPEAPEHDELPDLPWDAVRDRFFGLLQERMAEGRAAATVQAYERAGGRFLSWVADVGVFGIDAYTDALEEGVANRPGEVMPASGWAQVKTLRPLLLEAFTDVIGEP